MQSENETSIAVLNHLIEICKDGQNGFHSAADNADDTDLSRIFNGYSVQRAGLVHELQDRVRTLGGKSEKSGTVSGSLHRDWMNLKSAIASNETHAVLAECERGEDAAVAAYREALDEMIDGATRELLLRQYGEIRAAHDHIKQLRDSPAYAKS